MSPSELQTLIQRSLDGELAAVEFAALEAELIQNPEALAAYRTWVAVHCGLQRHAMRNSAVSKLPVVPIDRVLTLQRHRSVRISLLAAAAVLLVSAVGLWFKHSSPAPHTLAGFHTAPGSSFTLTNSGEGKRLIDGNLAQGTMIVLDHGVAELILPHDVRAIVEAPATLTFVDDRTINLDRGRAFFEVLSPEGRGFTVVTPRQRIVDLGTAFGIDLPVGSDQTHLHVFAGSVRIEERDADGIGEVIHAPIAVAIRGFSTLEQLDESADRFRRKLPDRVERILVEDFESGLLADKDYAILMDRTAIRDLAGNRFAGISNDEPWRFSTSRELRIRNPGFEAARVEGGTPVPYWQEVSRMGKGFNTYNTHPSPTEGALYLTVTPERTLAQDLGVSIRAGTTYTLILDVGNEPSHSNSRAIVSFIGSDAGYQKPLAGVHVDPPLGGWLRSQTLSYTATTEDATGQTLGIALSSLDARSTFDDLRIFETHGVDHVESPGNPVEERDPGGQPDTTSPFLSSFDPAPDASHVPLDATPTLVFDEPIRFGTGRIMIRNLTDGSETELVVGSASTSLNGRILSFLPPLELEDGASQIGGIPGWESSGPVSRFNPGGNGHRYHHSDLADDSKTRGAIGAMKGPTLATLGTRGQPASIRRPLGPVEKGRTYTVSVGIGSRSSHAADTPPFAGYRIRLLCDSFLLSEISGRTPPGPPDSVKPVGFSWDSRHFPSHLAADAPLVLEISSLGDRNNDGGYLDLDHVQVTSLDGAEH